MKQVKCANCGRTQAVEVKPTNWKATTPFEHRRLRWFYVEGLDVVLCGGSLSKNGVDDGRDWCLHLHRENHKDLYGSRAMVLELFLPGIEGKVPKKVVPHLEDVDED